MRTAFAYPIILGVLVFAFALRLELWQLMIPAAILGSLGKAMYDQPEKFEKWFPILRRI